MHELELTANELAFLCGLFDEHAETCEAGTDAKLLAALSPQVRVGALYLCRGFVRAER